MLNKQIGRKNWLFSDTPKGAGASAIVHSFEEIVVKLNKISKYFDSLFDFIKPPHLLLQNEDGEVLLIIYCLYFYENLPIPLIVNPTWTLRPRPVSLPNGAPFLQKEIRV